MEKLRAAGARQAYDVFDVRQTGSKSTDRGAIENTASRGEKPDDKTPTDDLEPPIPNVAMRHAITREMKRDAEYRRSCARAHGSADGRAGRGMERDNHAAVLAHEGHSPEASPAGAHNFVRPVAPAGLVAVAKTFAIGMIGVLISKCRGCL